MCNNYLKDMSIFEIMITGWLQIFITRWHWKGIRNNHIRQWISWMIFQKDINHHRNQSGDADKRYKKIIQVWEDHHTRKGIQRQRNSKHKSRMYETEVCFEETKAKETGRWKDDSIILFGEGQTQENCRGNHCINH